MKFFTSDHRHGYFVTFYSENPDKKISHQKHKRELNALAPSFIAEKAARAEKATEIPVFPARANFQNKVQAHDSWWQN